MSQISNKRIVKNTGFLYLRLLVLLFVSLYTSRIVLENLGVTDFGIYNVVGGVAALCVFFSSSLTNASERFLNIALGKKDYNLANRIFNQNLLIFISIAIVVIISAETFVKWWVFDKLDIPADKRYAAWWVYQFTIGTVVVNLLGIVYLACIVANEKMKIFSYIGIMDGFIKLGIAFLINAFPIENLIAYSAMLFLETCLIQGSYAIYCHKTFRECKLRYTFDKNLIKQIYGFVGWNIAGTGIYITKDTCINILMNIFFGPIVNAARAVAIQITNAVGSFTNNVFVAIRPQMMKAYAAQEMEELRLLFFRASKFSFLLFWFISLPLILCINQLLGIWLKDVPAESNIFAIWVLVDNLLAILTNPTWAIALASGKIKKYTLLGNGVLLIALPLSYVAFHFGAPPVAAFQIIFLARVLQVVSVVNIIKQELHYSAWDYLKTIVIPIIGVISVSFVITFPMKLWILDIIKNPYLIILLIGLLCVIINGLSILLIGMKRTEREKVILKIKGRF